MSDHEGKSLAPEKLRLFPDHWSVAVPFLNMTVGDLRLMVRLFEHHQDSTPVTFSFDDHTGEPDGITVC